MVGNSSSWVILVIRQHETLSLVTSTGRMLPKYVDISTIFGQHLTIFRTKVADIRYRHLGSLNRFLACSSHRVHRQLPFLGSLLSLELHLCIRWGSIGPAMNALACNTRNGVHTCTKAAVIHAQGMSVNAGVLVLKRMSCQDSKCAVFKVSSQ